MSDTDYASPSAGIDSALDNAFSAIGAAKEDIGAAIDDGALPPNALSTDGIFRQAQEIYAARKAAKADKAKAAKAEKVDQRTKAEAQDDGLEDSIDKAQKKSAEAQKQRREEREEIRAGTKPRPLSTRDFNSAETIQHRRELSERFPGKLSERMAGFERWDEAFKRDPLAAHIALRDEGLKVSPQNFRKPKQKAEAPGLDGVFDRAQEGASDWDDLKPYIEKYGERLPEVLRQLNEFERDWIDDPEGVSARLYANYAGANAPIAPAQPQQQAQASSPEADYRQVTETLEQAIERNVLPALANEQIANAVADVLTKMPRTANWSHDLVTAYKLVVQSAGQSAPASDNGKGQKSIHGAPATGGGKRSVNTGMKGLDESLDRAFGRV